MADGPDLSPITAAFHRVPPGDPPAYGMRFADEHLVAEAAEGGPWPRVADVLIVRGDLRWWAVVRDEFPGRLVTAFVGGKEGLLEVATGGLARLVPLPLGAGDAVWPYASFVHAWTTAGRPLDALHDARLTEEAPGPRRGVRIILTDRSTAWRAVA